MTERLYYADCYLTRFEATLLGLDASGRRLYLDQTAFYPTSGGQPFDLGRLRSAGAGASLELVDVVDEGERIAHVLAEPHTELQPGSSWFGEVDWPRRFDHMQQHSGQHLLSAVFQELWSAGTLSVHFGPESSTLDLDAATLSREQLQAVEQRANRVVFENRELSVGVEDAGAAGLRKPTTRAGALRIVSIAGIDRSACGGTHVRRTGEIGPISLRKVERVRKSVRVEFLCGERATRRARTDYELLLRSSSLFSTGIDELPAVLEARSIELTQALKRERELQQALDEVRAREQYARALERAPSAPRVCLLERRQSGGLQDLRGLAQQYIGQPRAVFVAAVDQPPALLIAAAEDSGIDAAALLRSALTAAGGRGGGSARLAQGSAPSVEALEQALATVTQQLGLAASNSPT
ncbi:MAG: alanyl-tRNA editing protein [Deltaproteobacteria bacterium]